AQGAASPRDLSPLEKHEPEAVAEYLANLQPRSPSLPWPAPIYDGRQAVAQPRVFGIASDEGYNGRGEWKEASYHCQTEQGTGVVTDERKARGIARWGESYNPFMQPLPEGHGTRIGEGMEPAGPAAAVGAEVFGAVGTVGRPDVAPEFGTLTRPVL